jgi:LysM repeat protein
LLAYHRAVSETSATGSTARVSWGSRILAPLALIAVLVAIVVIVSANTGDDSKVESDTKAQIKAEQKKDGEGAENPRTYTVEEGDTLGGIAEKFGVSTKRLERLNPDVDPQTLNAGQEIQIR